MARINMPVHAADKSKYLGTLLWRNKDRFQAVGDGYDLVQPLTFKAPKMPASEEIIEQYHQICDFLLGAKAKYDEDSPVIPDSDYDRAKAEKEKYEKTYSGLDLFS